MPNYSPDTTVAITLRHFEKESKSQAEREYDAEHGPLPAPLPDDDPSIDPRVRAIHKKRRKVRSAIVSRRKTAVYLDKLEHELQSRDHVNAALAKRLAVYHEVIADMKSKIGSMQRTIHVRNQLGVQQARHAVQPAVAYALHAQCVDGRQEHDDIGASFSLPALNDAVADASQLPISVQMCMPLSSDALQACNVDNTVGTSSHSTVTPSSITAVQNSNSSPFFLGYSEYDTPTTSTVTTPVHSTTHVTSNYDSTISVEEIDGLNNGHCEHDNTVTADSFAMETQNMVSDKNVHDYSSECSDGILSPAVGEHNPYVIAPHLDAFA